MTPQGPAARAGVIPGDTVVSVDGYALRDVIDWRWLTADGPFAAEVLDAAGVLREIAVEPAWDESPGVEFASLVFDGIRECDNACEFCFVAQLPPGLRPSLYVRDDDFRLSFLAGNFVTLTNLDGEDVARILEQRLSPLYVSLHAVDEGVRRSLICATAEDRALEIIDELVAEGIAVHVQVVLVPGRNDGNVLESTLEWLAGRPGVKSVGIVPVGFTAHQRRYRASYGDPRAAAGVLDALDPWQRRMSQQRGVPWVYAADELYLAAGREVPPAVHYAGFPQFENGIGMVRAFIDGWEAAVAEQGSGAGEPLKVALVTGELFAPVLADLVGQMPVEHVDARVLSVRNAFLGGNVSVAGLLTARDVADAIRADAGAQISGRGGGATTTYLVPDVMLNTEDVTLDDVAADDLPSLCGADVRVVSSDAADLVSAMGTMRVV